ncbi:hypothetical protein GE118_04140 [Mycoplasma sp. NEAQ87857]|uniref:Mbov_0401 family ICE element transposase-like protein n=1 Tax=Mycoplasma sp. NEAQ87857 TaxID=2683967 RepID=UPI001317F23B|nr:UPF0236 family protein [Mycoplasma sp. NEAQ87857]QGZ97966.1 hypothetical protein GE118_04140 [Mycoplasma sp. NEAQ87857]
MVYEVFIIYLNQIEEKFRTETRLKFFPKWIVSRRVKRKLITSNGIYYFNLTRYKIYDEALGKYRTFTYYHHEYLEQLKTSKFDIKLKKDAISNYINGNKTKDIFSSFNPSKQLIHFWIKNENILNNDIKLCENNQWNYIDNLTDYSNNVIKNEHKYLYVEIDDAFFSVQNKHKTIGKRSRMLRFYLEKDSQKKQVKCKNELFYLENSNKASKVSIEYLIEQINYIKDTFYNKDLKIVVKGDGAKWIQKLANSKDYIPILDKFHFMKLTFDTFGATKKKNKENSIFYENKDYFYNDMNLYNSVENAINSKNINVFNHLLNFIKEKVLDNLLPKLRQKIKKFLRYIKNNWNGISNLIKSEVNVKSSTESFVNNSLKRLIKKRGSRYNIKSIVYKIMMLGDENVGRFICW